MSNRPSDVAPASGPWRTAGRRWTSIGSLRFDCSVSELGLAEVLRSEGTGLRRNRSTGTSGSTLGAEAYWLISSLTTQRATWSGYGADNPRTMCPKPASMASAIAPRVASWSS
jgi:hypothetical protein